MASRGILTWFLAPAHLLVTGLGWLAWRLWSPSPSRRRDPWPVVAAVGGAVTPALPSCSSAVLAVRGPGGYWFAFWAEPARRTAYVIVSFMLFGWVLVCLPSGPWRSRGRPSACGGSSRSVSSASTLLAVGGLLASVGLEDALTVWNDQLALLPWGLSRILGITTYLGIPLALPWWILGTGAAVGALAIALAMPQATSPSARGAEQP